MAKGNRGGKRAGKITSIPDRLSELLPKIDVNSDWAFQPDDDTDLNDLKQNPIPYV